MPNIVPRKNADGVVYAYKVTIYLGRDDRNRKIRKYTTIPRPSGLTPKREEREVMRLAEEWERSERESFYDEKKRSEAEAAKSKGKTTLIDFIDNHWMKKHVNDGKHTPSTIAFYANMSAAIKSYFAAYKPDILLKDVSKEDVLDYLLYLRTEAKQVNGNPYGATTIQHRFSTLRNILEYAVYIDYIKEDPCKKIKPSDRPRRESREVDFLTEEEAIRFMSCLESPEEVAYWDGSLYSYLFWKALVNTLIVTGLRRGELVGLQWRDLDKKNSLLHVSRNVTLNTAHRGDTDPAKKIHIGEVKGKTVRKVPISKYLLDLLLEYKEEQAERYGSPMPQDAFIFCRTDNIYLPIYPTGPTQLLHKFIDRHGLQNVSPHDLRHTAASLAIQSGANVKEIQKLLGHKDPSTTIKFYTGISEHAQRQTIEGIESILRKNSKDTESKNSPET